MPREPIFEALPLKLPIITVDSDWPKPSIIEIPVAFLNWLNTSGFSASPAMEACLMEDRSNLERSSRIKNRYMVGGAQKVVMLYFLNMGRMSPGSNFSKS